MPKAEMGSGLSTQNMAPQALPVEGALSSGSRNPAICRALLVPRRKGFAHFPLVDWCFVLGSNQVWRRVEGKELPRLPQLLSYHKQSVTFGALWNAVHWENRQGLYKVLKGQGVSLTCIK